MKLHTVGHSNLSWEDWTHILKAHNINAIADVRSHPYSRYLPHFNRDYLSKALKPLGIKYVFLGNELGARPTNPDCYLQGKADYRKIAATSLFEQGIKRILKGAELYNLALMCSEKDPIQCHRAILICHHLRCYSLDIFHIRNLEVIETHQQLETRLLNLNKSDNLSLFDQSLEEAYGQQGDRLAYSKYKKNL